jgi:hypothetical protein
MVHRDEQEGKNGRRDGNQGAAARQPVHPDHRTAILMLLGPGSVPGDLAENVNGCAATGSVGD